MQQHSKKRNQNKTLLRIVALIILIGNTAVIALCFSFKEGTKAQVQESVPATQIEVLEKPEAILIAGIATFIEGSTEDIEPIPVPETQIHSFDWDADEAYLLAKIAMAEAEGEDTEGKALVVLTVLNRVRNEQFPDTISEVIYQEGQFTPIANGRFDKVEPSEDCWEALALVENGWDESQGALYFERITEKSTWHNRNLEKLFDHGNHTFYTEEAKAE